MSLTKNDIITFMSDISGVVAMTADESNGAPRAAWGDSFFFYAPEGDPQSDRRMPFATIVTQDYVGFDTMSDLNRHDIFRLNIAVGRTVFQELLGYPPAAHGEHTSDFDYTITDQLLPHPVYAAQAWVCVLNPGNKTADRAKDLLTDAYLRAAQRYRP